MISPHTAHPHATATFTTAPASRKTTMMSTRRLTLLASRALEDPCRTPGTATFPKGGILLKPKKRTATFSDLRALPYWPIWPGVITNTLFYAAILWLLIPGPFVLRRYVRVRRGLCPACGYDLKHAEHESCPECGRRQQSLQPGG